MRLRVLLADDYAMFRTAMRMLLEMDPDIEVVAEVTDGDSVLAAVGESRPDVVCMDLSMPGLNGVEATRQILATCAEVKVIALSAHVESYRIAEMIDAGALGYVVKMRAGTELAPAIRLVSLNQPYFSPELGLDGTAIGKGRDPRSLMARP